MIEEKAKSRRETHESIYCPGWVGNPIEEGRDIPKVREDEFYYPLIACPRSTEVLS